MLRVTGLSMSIKTALDSENVLKSAYILQYIIVILFYVKSDFNTSLGLPTNVVYTVIRLYN